LVPLGGGVQDKPQYIKNSTRDNQSKSELDVAPIKKIHEVNREKTG
jgi:hypothetical protein